MDAREQRGLVIAAVCKLKKHGRKWEVPSQSGNGKTYSVSLESQECTCPDCKNSGFKCKHIYAVEIMIRRERGKDGTITETRKLSIMEKVTYPQDWTAYNKAQQEEKKQFQALLHDLCLTVQEPVRKGVGRLPVLAKDAIFAAAFKVYSTISSRRFTTDLEDAHGKGYMTRMLHFNSVLKAFENETLTPIFKELIARSSLPLKTVEVDFAPDSTGFSTSRFVRWFDHKYGVIRTGHDWVKVHVMCGVKTNVVTAVEILHRNAADAPQFGALVKKTKENFTIREISADKGYLSEENISTAFEAGAVPFIMFKQNSTDTKGGLWEKMFHYFQFNKDEFLQHYHKRSNVESTFSMIKAKFGDHIRSRTDVAMKNEALAKILCHNICCVIQSMYELGVAPAFSGGKVASAAVN
jgi:transposase